MASGDKRSSARMALLQDTRLYADEDSGRPISNIDRIGGGGKRAQKVSNDTFSKLQDDAEKRKRSGLPRLSKASSTKSISDLLLTNS